MLWFVYNILFAVGYTLMLPRFALRMWRRGGYRKDFLQRFGIYSGRAAEKLKEQRRIWIHAVSVGEVGVAMRFMEEIRQADAQAAFVLTTTTSTGHRMAEARMGPLDVLLYFPADFPVIVRRVLDLLKPRALVMTECELWPNLIRASARRGIPTILINGRLSAKSYAGYRELRVFFEAVVKSMDLILVQSAEDKERFEKLGATRERVKVVGSAKYDAAVVESAGEEKARRILAGAGIDKDDLIVVGGSTWSGEEDVLCDIYKRLRGVFRPLRLVLVPRHAERRAEVEAAVRKHGLSLKKRSEMSSDGEAASRRDSEGAAKAPGSGTEVLLVDSTGELTAFYACASVIFVGKSLLAHGGQNIIEPALLGKPIIVGPYMENFSAVMGDFLEANAVFQVQDAGGLEAALRSLLADDRLREEYGRRARGVVESRKGVVRESVRLITETISARQIIGSSH